ncbi:hypothetical protein JTE90_006511 [Oedothorax gibbosus]|uniref:Uncharacterized protein n=1 Tax=Oedothorax gibbosus TaxID=931172 RepID=A0AAV6VM94_9ARAC|nr:hypothetical protein JTE90_006511 [Oedothorax gibbosus]
MTSTYSTETARPYDPFFELRISPGRNSLDAELCRIGKIKKRLQPPGGKETGVFEEYRCSPKDSSTPIRRPKKQVQLPGGKQGIFDAFLLPLEDKINPIKKFNNNFRSTVFSPAEIPPPRPVTPRKLTTQYKLFEKSPPKIKVRKESNTMKSSALDVEDRVMVPRFYIKKDPITGLGIKCPETYPTPMNKRNPITFEGIAEKRFPCRSMQPPGGTSTIALEYIE